MHVGVVVVVVVMVVVVVVVMIAVVVVMRIRDLWANTKHFCAMQDAASAAVLVRE
jgi:hypothetical protein